MGWLLLAIISTYFTSTIQADRTTCRDTVYCNLILGDLMQYHGSSSMQYHLLAQWYTFSYMEPVIPILMTNAVFEHELITADDPYGVSNETDYKHIHAHFERHGIEFVPKDGVEWKQMVQSKQTIIKKIENPCKSLLEKCIEQIRQYDTCYDWQSIPRTKFNCTTISAWPEFSKDYLSESQVDCSKMQSTCGKGMIKEVSRRRRSTAEGNEDSKKACFGDIVFYNKTSLNELNITTFGDYGPGCGGVVSNCPGKEAFEKNKSMPGDLIFMSIGYLPKFGGGIEDIVGLFTGAIDGIIDFSEPSIDIPGFGDLIGGIEDKFLSQLPEFKDIIDFVNNATNVIEGLMPPTFFRDLKSDWFNLGTTTKWDSCEKKEYGTSVKVTVEQKQELLSRKEGVTDVKLLCNQPPEESNCNGYLDMISADAPKNKSRHLRNVTTHCRSIQDEPIANYSAGSAGLAACKTPGYAICALRTHKKGAELEPKKLQELGNLTVQMVKTIKIIAESLVTDPLPDPPEMKTALKMLYKQIVQLYNILKQMIRGDYVFKIDVVCCKLSHGCVAHGLYETLYENRRGHLPGNDSFIYNHTAGMEMGKRYRRPTQDVESSISLDPRFILHAARNEIKDLRWPTKPKLVNDSTCVKNLEDEKTDFIPEADDKRGYADGYENILDTFAMRYNQCSKAFPLALRPGLITRVYQTAILCGITRTWGEHAKPIKVEFIDPEHCDVSTELRLLGLRLDGGKKMFDMPIGTAYTLPLHEYLTLSPFLDHYEALCGLEKKPELPDLKSESYSKLNVFRMVAKEDIEVDFGSGRIPSRGLVFQQVVACVARKDKRENFTIYTDTLKGFEFPDTNCEPIEGLEFVRLLRPSTDERVISNIDDTKVYYDLTYGIDWIGRPMDTFIGTNYRVKELLDTVKPALKKIKSKIDYNWTDFDLVMADKSRQRRQTIDIPARHTAAVYQLTAKCGGLVLRTGNVFVSKRDEVRECTTDKLPVASAEATHESEPCTPSLDKVPEFGNCEASDYYVRVALSLQAGLVGQFDGHFSINVGLTWEGRVNGKNYDVGKVSKEFLNAMAKLGKSKGTRFDWASASSGMTLDLLNVNKSESKVESVGNGKSLQVYQLTARCGEYIAYMPVAHKIILDDDTGICLEGDAGFHCNEESGDGSRFWPSVKRNGVL